MAIGLPAFMTRAVWVRPSSELVRALIPRPATVMPATSATTTILRWVERSALYIEWFMEGSCRHLPEVVSCVFGQVHASGAQQPSIGGIRSQEAITRA